MKIPIDNMIDLETFGTKQNSMITAIGVCKFNIKTGKIDRKNTFYERIDWASSEEYGRQMDVETIRWWMEQSDAARLENIKPGIQLEDALEKLAKFLMPLKNAIVWGNGATFDISMLENTYEAVLGDIPWKFYNVNDVRTIVRLGKMLTGFDHKKVEFEGDKHNARADAMHQAKYVSMIYKELNGKVSMK